MGFVSPSFLVSLWLRKAEPRTITFTKLPRVSLLSQTSNLPPGSKIIRQLPGETDREVSQAQEPGKTQPNVQTEGSPKPTKNK